MSAANPLIEANVALDGYASKTVKGKDGVPNIEQVKITVIAEASDVKLDELKMMKGKPLGFSLGAKQLRITE